MTITREPTVIAENVSFADYLKRFEGQRTEWHAGKVVRKVSNNLQHNLVILFLCQVFGWFMAKRSIVGKVVQSGYPMFISDKVPAREPDIMLVLAEHFDRLKPTYLEGPADLAVEIISSDSASTDRGDKFIEYEAAGVPEYWLLDPIRKSADVFVLDQEGHYQRTSLDDRGRLVSSILPGFALDPAILWRDELPQGPAIVELVDTMLESKTGG
jgi:Uma2 family endonuclease